MYLQNDADGYRKKHRLISNNILDFVINRTDKAQTGGLTQIKIKF